MTETLPLVDVTHARLRLYDTSPEPWDLSYLIRFLQEIKELHTFVYDILENPFPRESPFVEYTARSHAEAASIVPPEFGYPTLLVSKIATGSYLVEIMEIYNMIASMPAAREIATGVGIGGVAGGTMAWIGRFLHLGPDHYKLAEWSSAILKVRLTRLKYKNKILTEIINLEELHEQTRFLRSGNIEVTLINEDDEIVMEDDDFDL